MRIRVYLERVRLDAGGYVRKGQAVVAGTYYGVGAPLYRYYAEWEEPNGQPGRWIICEDVIRADNREQAKDIIRDTRMSYRARISSRLRGRRAPTQSTV